MHAEKGNYKTPGSFIYHLGNAKFVFILRFHIVLCHIFRKYPVLNCLSNPRAVWNGM